MKAVLMAVIFVICFASASFALDAVEAPRMGWGPSAVASVGAFYLNGNYKLLSGGFGGGAAYTWSHGENVNSAGIYLGPQSTQINGLTSTGLTLMLYVDLFKSQVGQFGLGLGTDFWQAGEGMRSPNMSNTFLAFAYKF